MQILSGELGGTKTYAARSWTWIGRMDGTQLHDGTLTVNFVKGKTARATVESRRYFVQEVPCDHGGRTFLLLKEDGQSDAHEQDVYQVFVGDNGLITCTCKADHCKAPCCVHKDVIPALIDAGAFDQPIDPPSSPEPTPEEVEAMGAAFESEQSGLWFPEEPNGLCDLCGVPMGDEVGHVHEACAAAEAATDELPDCFRNIGGSGVRVGVPF